MSSDLAQPNPHFLHHHGVYSLGLLGGADSPGGGLVGLQAKGFPSASFGDWGMSAPLPQLCSYASFTPCRGY
jgi:hypothetical protein